MGFGGRGVDGFVKMGFLAAALAVALAAPGVRAQGAPGGPPPVAPAPPSAPPAPAPVQAGPPPGEVRPGPAARAPRQARGPREYRGARYPGGRGATWRTGRDAYGFGGSYGGCRYRGVAGPGGYRLQRSC